MIVVLVLCVVCAILSVLFGGFAIYYGNKLDDFEIFMSRLDSQATYIDNAFNQIETCKKSIKAVRSCLVTDCSVECSHCSYYRDMDIK